MDVMIYFPVVLGLFHSAVTCSATGSALGCNFFWIIFYCIAMLVAYGAFIYALRYTYKQDAIKNNYNHITKSTLTNSKLKQASTLDTTFSNNITNVELANRISKALYQL